jgi:phage terminase large subunit-like protein
MGLSIQKRLLLLPDEERRQYLAGCEQWVLEEMARGEWWYVSRPEQVPPEGEQLIDLVLAGRGFGKSRAGSEWIVDRSRRFPLDRHGVPTERLVMARTIGEAKAVCLEGPSGILNVLTRRGIRYKYLQSPHPRIVLDTGAKIYARGAESPDSGRGLNLADFWGDEMAMWAYPKETWYEGLMPALRADLAEDHPRAFITTTPKPIALLQEWLDRKDGSVHLITGSTFDNADNLNSYILAELLNRYEGTDLGRQELYGEMLAAMDGALFKRSDLAAARVDEVPDEIVSIVVGVDPSLTDEGDETGIIVVARTRDNHLYVLADRSIQASGREACRHVWQTFAEFGADVVLIETTIGKKFLDEVLRDTYLEMVRAEVLPPGTTPPVERVDSKIGKKTRAEPVALRSQQLRLHMVGVHAKLEDQLCLFTSWDGRESPDRLDAMVHACRHLIGLEQHAATVTTPKQIRELVGGRRGTYDPLGVGADMRRFGWR